MKIAIIGSRDFIDYDVMKKFFLLYTKDLEITQIISGGAKGADSLAERLAREFQISTMIFRADWKTHGRAAGIIRNKDIVENADIVMAFWVGKSPGTKNSIYRAHKLNKKVYIIKF
jgi:hypothetical protein